MLSRYESMTKKGLLEKLEIKEIALNYINKEIEVNTKIIKGYFESITDQKELYKKLYQEWNSIDDLKWKVLIMNKHRELEQLRESKKDIENHITAIKENLSTYDTRMNKIFGRKSPFIQMDFGYNINLKVV